MDAERKKRLLLRFGVTLFLLGLLTGLVVPTVANPRMALSSHLEGVQNGIVLIVLAFVWPELRLGRGLGRFTFVLFIYGTYVNWASTLLAAMFGTGRMTPLAAEGFEGTDLQEAIVNFGLVSLSFAMIVGVSIVLWGLRGRSPKSITS